MKIVRRFYQPLMVLFGLVYLPHFLARLGQAQDKQKLLNERFGYIPGDFQGKKVVWIHAVSVGEVMAAREFIRLLHIVHPDLLIALSTTTPTGQAIAKKLENAYIRVFYFPFDFSGMVRRALDRICPRCIIIMETEMWPNLIDSASKRGIPIGIINGRISQRAFKRYQWVKEWFRELIQKLAFYLVCDEQDRERFHALGAEFSRLRVTGNMKFDIEGSRNPVETERLRDKWGFRKNQVIVAGSTHEGEEEVVIRVFQKLRNEFPALKLVLAPRHTERARKVLKLVAHAGLRSSFASASGSSSPEVVILDFVGELSKYYGLADIVFMGGSLIPHGGQNPIEPARERKVIFHGPHVFNFQSLYKHLDDLQGAILISDELSLYHRIHSILKDRDRMQAVGSRAFEVVDQLRGATHRNLMFLEPWLTRV